MERNRLGEETSPYLLQHKDNPVHWQPWDEASLAAAKAMGKPILLSIGYAACHWCHVMARESFEDPLVAQMMNARFVNIKVDREERPDLDAIYQNALAAMGEQGGWPLTMFLTPAGEPFWGGTYFPPTPRWGRPGFPQLLEAMSAAFARERSKVASNAGALREALSSLSRPQRGEAVTEELLDTVAERLLGAADLVDGGIAGAPKFPQAPIFELLWRAHKRSGREDYKKAVEAALDGMCQGGIYDHLGGGFARYSTDARWLIPHFEKMLYDNALLVDLLTLVFEETENPLYRKRVEETLLWVVREMTTAEGGFASSLDADSEHEEGKFYTWSEEEIDRVLGARAPLFKRVYDVSAGSNWEGRTILNRLKARSPLDAGDERALAACRALLFAAREKRVRPLLDDKVLVDWNALMIAAMANAGVVFARPDWLAHARAAFDFIGKRMAAGDGRLFHSWRMGRARHQATLDDYAGLCRAALLLYEASGESALLQRVEEWIAVLDAHFADPEGGGYFFAADDVPGLIARAKTAGDAAAPAGNATLAGVFARLWALSGEERWRERAEALIEAFSGEIGRRFFSLATLLNNAELLARPLQIVLVGEKGSAALEALRREVYRVSLPNRIVVVLPPGAFLPASHPAHGKGLVGGRPAAYVCEGPVCSLPMTDSQELRADLLARR